MNAHCLFAIVLLLSLLSGGCAGQPALPAQPPDTVHAAAAATTPGQVAAPSAALSPDYWPTDDWRTARPEEQGLDSAKLDEMLAKIDEDRLALHSLLIFRNGYLVRENYFGGQTPNRRHEIFSCTKSFIATLVGIALDQGLIQSVDQTVLEFFPGRSFKNMDAGKEAMTLADVLTMTSGLEWTDTGAAFQNLYSSQDWVAHMLDLPMEAAPGRYWNYCSGCSHLLSSILQQTTPQGTLAFAQKNLFEPLGIKNYRWDTDADGVPIGGWGLQMTPREMAKLGYLYLKNGNWDGKQVVSAGWVRQATQSRYATDNKRGLGYGYQWWTYPTYGAYTALGRDGQIIFVVPEINLMVVATAELDGHEQVFDLIDDYILPAVNRATILPSEGQKTP